MRQLCASDLMNSDVLTVREDTTVHDLAAFLTDNEISGAPVLDSDGQLIGVVSVVDIVAASSDEGGFERDESNPDFFLRDLQETYSEEEIQDLHLEVEGMTVADIMTPSVYSVAEDASVSEIASTMLSAHLHRLLVTNGDGALVGIISTSDLLGLLIDEE